MQKRIGVIVLIGFVLLPVAGFSFQSQNDPDGAAGCLTCHQGIESIGDSHAGLECADCHGGDAGASVMEAAHSGMHRNPGDLNIIDQTCGICHGDVVDRVLKSLHATSAGVISGARYLWAAQDERHALYAVRAVTDDDGEVPEDLGAVSRLEDLPHYTDSDQPVDDYLRNQCLRCHL